jgi:hypothetical protein
MDEFFYLDYQKSGFEKYIVWKMTNLNVGTCND